MSRTWLSIRVDLVGGRGEEFWPRPGRIFAAARSHTFAQLATAIDDAFARWDRAHLHQFQLTDGLRIGRPDDWDIDAEQLIDGRRTSLARLRPGEQFVYEFDFGDSWTHLCTVGPNRIDPLTDSVSPPTTRCPTGAGETSPTSTAAAGTPTPVTKPATPDPTPGWPTSRRCGPGGDHNPNANPKPQQRTA